MITEKEKKKKRNKDNWDIFRFRKETGWAHPLKMRENSEGVTTYVPRESARGTRWLCTSLTLNIAEAKGGSSLPVRAASVYYFAILLSPSLSRFSLSFLCVSFSHPHHSSICMYLHHHGILPFVLCFPFFPHVMIARFRKPFNLIWFSFDTLNDIFTDICPLSKGSYIIIVIRFLWPRNHCMKHIKGLILKNFRLFWYLLFILYDNKYIEEYILTR